MTTATTVAVTAAVAIVVFVVTQSFLKFVLEPVQEQKKLIGEVAHALLFCANVSYMGTPWDLDEKTREQLNTDIQTLRNLAMRLRASLWTVPFYGTLAVLRGVPKKDSILEASSELIWWSNNLYGPKDEERIRSRKAVAGKLGISKVIDIS